MSNESNNDDDRVDCFTEPGIWFQKLVYGVWDLLWHFLTTGLIYVGLIVALFFGLALVIRGCGSTDSPIDEFSWSISTTDASAERSQIRVLYHGIKTIEDARFTISLEGRDGRELRFDQQRNEWLSMEPIHLEVPNEFNAAKVTIIGLGSRGGRQRRLYFDNGPSS